MVNEVEAVVNILPLIKNPKRTYQNTFYEDNFKPHYCSSIEFKTNGKSLSSCLKSINRITKNRQKLEKLNWKIEDINIKLKSGLGLDNSIITCMKHTYRVYKNLVLELEEVDPDLEDELSNRIRKYSKSFSGGLGRVSYKKYEENKIDLKYSILFKRFRKSDNKA
ncbi:MAG: hypothetical protein JSV92_05210 [archaeon]|nr:MAG: hypothetical protein JSV92_05210 [archaeon]